MLLNCGVGEDSWESLGLQGDPTNPLWRRSALGFLWKEWYWSWNSSTLATSCEELTHWKRLWCWVGFGARGEGDDRGWDGWMASLTWWTWIWVNSRSWWSTGRPGMLRFMGSQRVRHNWVTELNWTELNKLVVFYCSLWVQTHDLIWKLPHWSVYSLLLPKPCRLYFMVLFLSFKAWWEITLTITYSTGLGASFPLISHRFLPYSAGGSPQADFLQGKYFLTLYLLQLFIGLVQYP